MMKIKYVMRAELLFYLLLLFIFNKVQITMKINVDSSSIFCFIINE